MLNQIVLVGRLTKDVEVITTDSGKKMSEITLAIPRCFKNMNGEYDTDFISCTVYDKVAENTAEYCRKGDIIGVKGRVQSRTKEIDGKNKTMIEVVAEKVTFLSSRNHNETEKSDKEQEGR